MVEADIVVSSTGCPETILRRDDIAKVMPARRNRPLFLIDIAVPRDIDSDIQQLNNVYLYNVDHLEALVRQNVQVREQELTKCHEIIDERCTALMSRFAQPSPKGHEPANTFDPGLAFGGAATCAA